MVDAKELVKKSITLFMRGSLRTMSIMGMEDTSTLMETIT
jgi:hypothetical protein